VHDKDIEDCISLANRCAYALIGSGLHSNNGIGAKVCLQIFNTYVMHWSLYGLEVTILKNKQIKELSAYRIRMLKQFQGLPRRTADISVYALLGTLPLCATLYLRQFSVIGSIARGDNQFLKCLALHQAALRDASSGSCFASVDSSLSEYGLPNIKDLI
jgi:hypothetical protein